jgi:hypothetical protein
MGDDHTRGFSLLSSGTAQRRADAAQISLLPSGYPAGTPEEALDCACGLYLADPAAWFPPADTPTDLRTCPLGFAGQVAHDLDFGPQRQAVP